uniref:Uncharacterized protein n=1 Tax=Candidozyma auris TaxID=498019 RepID=A0A0L0P0M9_CANAR
MLSAEAVAGGSIRDARIQKQTRCLSRKGPCWAVSIVAVEVVVVVEAEISIMGYMRRAGRPVAAGLEEVKAWWKKECFDELFRGKRVEMIFG